MGLKTNQNLFVFFGGSGGGSISFTEVQTASRNATDVKISCMFTPLYTSPMYPRKMVNPKKHRVHGKISSLNFIEAVHQKL